MGESATLGADCHKRPRSPESKGEEGRLKNANKGATHWPANKPPRPTYHPWWIWPWCLPKSVSTQLHTTWNPDSSELRLAGRGGRLHPKHCDSYIEVRWPRRSTSPFNYAGTISQHCLSWQWSPKYDHRPATTYSGFCSTMQPQPATSAPELQCPQPGSGRWAVSARRHTPSPNPCAGRARWYAPSPKPHDSSARWHVTPPNPRACSARWHAASPNPCACSARWHAAYPNPHARSARWQHPQPSHMQCQMACSIPQPFRMQCQVARSIPQPLRMQCQVACSIPQPLHSQCQVARTIYQLPRQAP